MSRGRMVQPIEQSAKPICHWLNMRLILPRALDGQENDCGYRPATAISRIWPHRARRHQRRETASERAARQQPSRIAFEVPKQNLANAKMPFLSRVAFQFFGRP